MSQENLECDLSGGSSILSRSIFHQDQEIFQEGTMGTAAYIVESGRAEVSRMVRGKKAVLGTLGPRALFGEMAVLDASPRMATVKAIEPTVLIELCRTKLTAELEKSPQVIQVIIRLLLNNLRENSKHMLKELEAEDGAESGADLAAAE